MRFEIIFAPQAVEDFKRLSARDRSFIRDQIEIHLRFEPQKTSKSRIKRLKGLEHPQYRLRSDEFRVFYDVIGESVHVIAIVAKSTAADWLDEIGSEK